MPVGVIQKIGFEITENGAIVLNTGQISHRALIMCYPNQRQQGDHDKQQSLQKVLSGKFGESNPQSSTLFFWILINLPALLIWFALILLHCTSDKIQTLFITQNIMIINAKSFTITVRHKSWGTEAKIV